MGVVKNTLLWEQSEFSPSDMGMLTLELSSLFIWEILNDLYIILRHILIGSSSVKSTVS